MKALLLVCAVVVLVLVGHSRSGGETAAAGRTVADDHSLPARAPDLRVFGGGRVTKVVARTSAPALGDEFETHSTALSPIPGAVIDFRVPAGDRAILMIRFSASDWCQGPTSHYCSVVIHVNGQEAHPRAGGSARFDSGAAENQESHAIERLIGPLTADRTYRVRVLAETSTTALSFRVFEWALVVEQVRAS